MKFLKTLFVLTALLVVIPSAYGHPPIRVVCVGNSITYGAGIANREKNSYPKQLQYLLGSHYKVLNAGCNSATLLSEGDYPYIERDEYKQSLEFEPHIVIIKLGTNDAKPQNRIKLDQYKSDYQKLIDSYRALPTEPRIILATPVRCYLGEDEFSTQAIESAMIPVIRELALENNLEILNFYTLFSPEYAWEIMPDRLHPSSIGAGMMARKAYEVIETYDEGYDLVKAFADEKTEDFNFYGYAGARYKLQTGVEAMIVRPKIVADGRPWVLRARFWGHEPQTDIDLLERGFHIAYCDVAELFGSPEAVARWDYFYRRMTEAGAHPKVVLEGMSRGGLPVYNWAVKNPEKVACIYADAPVMDLKSWPMGEGKYRGAEPETAQMMKAYGFRSKQEALDWKGNPVDHAEAMARSGIPMLHVVGDVDEIVPVDENTAPFEQQVKAHGGNITVIHKPKTGHHPHSLAVPQPIVDFILRATRHKTMYCTKSLPGNEFRSGAGWTEGSEWHTVSEEISEVAGRQKLDLLLIGNSITQGFGGNRERVTYKPGKTVMDSRMGDRKWESAGISGDRTENIIWRIENGGYEKAEPRNVVITIGVNNIAAGGDSALETAVGIIEATACAASRFPDSNIILFGLLPVGLEKNHPLRIKYDEIHKTLAEAKFARNVTYIDPTCWFTESDGMLQAELYSGDHLHLSDRGYEVWSEEIVKLLK